MNVDWGSINYLAVVAAVVAHTALGALWYSPVLFAKPWMAANGFTAEGIAARGAEAMRGYATAIVGSLVGALALAILVQLTGGDSAADGILMGLLAGIGLVFVATAVNYSFEDRPVKLLFINGGYPVVGLMVQGAILALWR